MSFDLTKTCPSCHHKSLSLLVSSEDKTRGVYWCNCSAYGENHPCDEHSYDDSRGRNCSADELLNELKEYLKK